MARVARGLNPSRWPWRHWILAALILAGLVLFWLSPPTADTRPSSPSTKTQATSSIVPDVITAPNLDPESPLALAQLSVDALLARQSRTLSRAVARYSLRAGRSPPPNYDKWFSFAQEHKCLIDEYDQIHRDFEPFYELARDNPIHFSSMIDRAREQMLREAMGLISPRKQEAIGLTTINIKNGKTVMAPYRGTPYSKDDLPITLRNFNFILPDMEFFLNGRDEPRVVFNHREPGAFDRANNVSDPNPFHIAPHPTSDWFKERNGCSPLSSTKGFARDGSSDIPFLQSSSSSDFTLDLWPLLSMTKISPCFSDILFPGQYYYRKSRWSLKLKPDDIAWSNKISQLFWRGASNGGHIVGQNYRSFPRFRLIELARKHSDLINAQLTHFPDGHCTADCDRLGIIAEYNITGIRVSRNEVLKYKYLLDVDGNTFSGRFLSLLRSGSLVFKSTVFEEYFNDWLRPYEHYIPVRPDLSDLVERVHWAMKHDDEARRIQETGKLFVERVVTDSQNDCYFALVLLEWARLQHNATATF